MLCLVSQIGLWALRWLRASSLQNRALHYLSTGTRIFGGGRGGEKKEEVQTSSNAGMLKVLSCRLYKKTVFLGILLKILLLYIHIANFITNKALRARCAEEMYGNAIPWCSNNHCSIGTSTHTHTEHLRSEGYSLCFLKFPFKPSVYESMKRTVVAQQHVSVI